MDGGADELVVVLEQEENEGVVELGGQGGTTKKATIQIIENTMIWVAGVAPKGESEAIRAGSRRDPNQQELAEGLEREDPINVARHVGEAVLLDEGVGEGDVGGLVREDLGPIGR